MLSYLARLHFFQVPLRAITPGLDQTAPVRPVRAAGYLSTSGRPSCARRGARTRPLPPPPPPGGGVPVGAVGPGGDAVEVGKPEAVPWCSRQGGRRHIFARGGVRCGIGAIALAKVACRHWVHVAKGSDRALVARRSWTTMSCCSGTGPGSLFRYIEAAVFYPDIVSSARPRLRFSF